MSWREALGAGLARAWRVGCIAVRWLAVAYFAGLAIFFIVWYEVSAIMAPDWWVGVMGGGALASALCAVAAARGGEGK